MKIPKRIFFFWSGEKMSWLRYMTLKSFRFYNPDWEIDLYLCPDNDMKKAWNCPNQQDFFRYKGEDYFDRIDELNINVKHWEIIHPNGQSWADKVTPSQKSNFFKWETLYKEGGIYCDMDVLFTAPIDRYYTQIKNKGLSICFSHSYFSIGLLASTPGCDFFGDIWKNGFTCFDKGKYQTAGVINLYNLLSKVGPRNLKGRRGKTVRVNGWRILTGKYNKYNPHNIPYRTVYPWIYNELENYWSSKHVHKKLPPETIGLHWYAGADISQQNNDNMTPDNINEFESTIAHWIKKI